MDLGSKQAFRSHGPGKKETDDKTRGGGGENMLSPFKRLFSSPRCGDSSFSSHSFLSSARPRTTKPPH